MVNMDRRELLKALFAIPLLPEIALEACVPTVTTIATCNMTLTQLINQMIEQTLAEMRDMIEQNVFSNRPVLSHISWMTEESKLVYENVTYGKIKYKTIDHKDWWKA